MQFSSVQCSANHVSNRKKSKGNYLYHNSRVPRIRQVIKKMVFPFIRHTMWNRRSPCGAESVAERRSSHCWTSRLDLDKENHWWSTPAVAPDGWVQWALHNPSICCSQLPLDGAAQNDLGSVSSQAVTHLTICGAKPCLTLKLPREGQMALPLNLNDKNIPNADFFLVFKIYTFLWYSVSGLQLKTSAKNSKVLKEN